MGFSLGYFDKEYLNKSPIVILERDERILAFANLTWINEDYFSVDLVRFRDDTGVESLMLMLYLHLINWVDILPSH